MRIDTKQRKKAMFGFRQMTGTEIARQSLHRVMSQGKQALDRVFLDIGRMLAESIMLMEREELAGPDYQPINPNVQKWAHEEGSVYIADQKVKVKRPRLRDINTGEIKLKSYEKLSDEGQFSQDMLDKVLRGMSAQKYEETVMESASAFGVSPSSVSRKMVEITSQKLR